MIGGYWRLKGVKKGYRRLQGITRGYRGLQEVREGYSRLQWVNCVARGSKRLGGLRRVTRGYMKKQ